MTAEVVGPEVVEDGSVEIEPTGPTVVGPIVDGGATDVGPVLVVAAEDEPAVGTVVGV